MIYQPSKYHTNSFTHFLQLHSSITKNGSNSLNRGQDDGIAEDHVKLDLNENSSSNTSLEVVNESIGKSFTIAAILGLKKSSVNHHLGLNQRQTNDIDVNNCMNDYNSDFSNIINLSAHSKLFQKFENENMHLNLHSNAQQNDPSMQVEQQCLYDNNGSNSSYQEQLHKQLNQEFNHPSMLNANFHRNCNNEPPNQHNLPSNAVMHNMQQHQTPANILNKALQQRDRSRIGWRFGVIIFAECHNLHYYFLQNNFPKTNLHHR